MELTTMVENQTFDFEKNSVISMNFDTLCRTHKENDIYGNPIRGMYHYKVLATIAELCQNNAIEYDIEEIFAAQNKNKNMPGVVILPQVEALHGNKAVEAHVLRRVFTTINLKNGENDELTTTLAIAYHQDGLQVAIGPNVKICHNQCVLGADRMAATYGKEKKTYEEIFVIVSEWLKNFSTMQETDRAKIERMKNTFISPEQIYIIIGMLTAMRVAHDSKDKRLSEQVGTYPLNQSQISVFTEDLLKLKQEKEHLTAWDVYNVATEIYKPEKSDFPTLIPQNVAFAEFIETFLN